MMKAPEKLGSEYYRGFLTRQGQAFYDRINTQLLRGDYSGKTTFSLSNPETSASDGFAAYKAITAYAPDTVVQASDDAGVKLKYQRDVNIVIKKFEDAIASMTTT